MLPWDDDRILIEACNREGHPDNASACWLGGLTAARMPISKSGNGSKTVAVHAVRVIPAVHWPVMLVVPRETLPTVKARGLLPSRYTRAVTVANLQSATLLMGAFTSGRGDLLQFACEGQLHEPYREHLCPLLAPLRSLNGRHGVLGVTLSGSGPSVLLFLDAKSTKGKIDTKVLAVLKKHGLDGELIFTSISDHGASESRKALKHFSNRRAK